MKDKDIYDLLNEIDINEDDFEVEEMETNDIEKMKVLNSVKDKINSSNKKKKTKKNVAIASILGLAIISSTLIYNSDSILASDIPIIKDIFNIFGYKKDFEENASKVNLYDENKYGSITIEEVLFDGTNVFLTYKFESKEPIDYILYNTSKCKVLNNKNLRISGSSSGQEKINANTFVGTETMKLYNLDDNKKAYTSDDISIKLTLGDFKYVNFDKENYKEDDMVYNINNGEEKTINDKWTFNLDLKPLSSETYKLNKIVEDNNTNLKINFNNIRISPIGFEIKYNYDLEDILPKYNQIEDNVDILKVGIKVKDELGNEYKAISGGGTGKYYLMENNYLFEKLDENAKKLYITPYYEVSKNGGQAIINEDGTSETIKNNPSNDILVLDNVEFETIEIDLETLK